MKSWIERYLDAWNSHEGANVGAFMADDAIYEDVALGVVHHGREAIEGFAEEAARHTSDFRFTAVSEQTIGDRYAFEWVMTGTSTSGAEGAPATSKSFRTRGVSIGRLDADGKITENRDYWNMAEYLRQVGVLPAPGA